MGKKHHKSKKHHKNATEAEALRGVHTTEKAEKKDKSKKSGKKSEKKAKLEKSEQEKPIKLVLKVGENVVSKEGKRKAVNNPTPSVSGEFTGKLKLKDHGSKKKKKKRSTSKERKKPKLDENPSVSLHLASPSPASQLSHDKSKKKRERQIFEISHGGAGETDRSVKKIYIKPILPPSGNNPEFRQAGSSVHVQNEIQKIVSYQDPTPLQLCLENLHRILQRKDTQGFFAFPVNDAIAPGYSSIITQPMDFSTIKVKVEANEYKTIEEFRDDFLLMCHNAMVYNASETIYCKAAKKLLQSGSKMLTQDKIRNMYVSLGFHSAGQMADVEAGTSDEPIDVDTVEGEENLLVQPVKKKAKLSKGESKHLSASRKILAQVQEASKRVAAELDEKYPKNKIGYLRRKADGSTTLAVLNPDSTEESLPVNLGSLVGKVTSGSHTTAGFKEDKKNKATPVSYLMYGPFGSFAPAYDSSRATITKEESDLLFTTYGDGSGIHYARSLQQFVKDSPFARQEVDNLLDEMTEGSHSKYLKQKTKSEEAKMAAERDKASAVQPKVVAEVLNTPETKLSTEEGASSKVSLSSDSSGIKIDLKSLMTLENEGFDMSFLHFTAESSKRDAISADMDELQKKLNQTGRLLEVLQEVQSTRLAHRPNEQGSATPTVAIKPSQEEKTIANRVTENLKEMTSQVRPNDVTAMEAIRAAMGVGLIPQTSATEHVNTFKKETHKNQENAAQKGT